MRFRLIIPALFTFAASILAEDGYELWLRYPEISNDSVRDRYEQQLDNIVFPADTPTLQAARSELLMGIEKMLGTMPTVSESPKSNVLQTLIIGTPESNPLLANSTITEKLGKVGKEGFVIQGNTEKTCVAANTDLGVLYGVFELLRLIQTQSLQEEFSMVSSPQTGHRLLNHWDNLDRTVERGYAGSSIWNWFTLPDFKDPRYTDYARLCASIGINGSVLTNVNADSKVLLDQYLVRVAALADIFRPYGIKVYLTARFSAPIEIGGLETADPLNEEVQAWWKAKADEIYSFIPDFGGFLVKANSEGQPGPQDYGRNHADGANMLAEALKPHGGIVMWRAFVYSHEAPDDRAKQAYNEFKPLDGTFAENVLIQIKNGPIDFMPREPFHPLFGAIPGTSISLELQITQEYLGASTQLCYLAPMWKECMDADTFRPSEGNTVSCTIATEHSAIAGVSNIGSDRNWTGHPMAAANFYAFGRLAWNHELSSEKIADEWTRMTFTNDPAAVQSISKMLLGSHQTVVNYSMPLGLHHIMAMGHHHGPGPWVDGIRADWTSVYYHRADDIGIGFDRTSNGSNALSQYAEGVQNIFSDPSTCPEDYLLWFHHLPWDWKTQSGQLLWDEICLRYQTGVHQVEGLTQEWNKLRNSVDSERHAHIDSLLKRQLEEAKEWRDACLLYFQTFSKQPFPAGVELSNTDLEQLKDRKFYVPGN